MSNLLDKIHSEEFREFLRENVIEYEEINGFKVVSSDFTTETLNHDPMEIVEQFQKEKGIDRQELNKESLALGLLSIQFKRVLEEEIAKANFDVTSKATVEEYLTCLDRLGFEVIHKIDYQLNNEGTFSSQESMTDYMEKNIKGHVVNDSIQVNERGGVYAEYVSYDSEYFLFNKQHSLLIHLDTYHGKTINSSNLICNVKEVKKDRELACSRGFVAMTDTVRLDTDMRDLPAHKMQLLLTEYKPVKNWLEFDTSLYSYLSHKKVEIEETVKWRDITFNKTKEFPEEVLERLFKDNVVISRDSELMMTSGMIDTDFLVYDEFLGSLTKEEYKEAEVLDIIFDARFSDNWKNIFPASVIKKAESENLDLDRLKLFGNLLYRHAISVENSKPLTLEDYKNVVEKLNNDKLEKFVKKTSEFSLNFNKELREVHEHATELLKSKQSIKRKNRLH